MMKYASMWLAVSVAAVAQAPPVGRVTKATFANVLKLNAYADNWCMVYINGKLAAVDQIEFLPHNVVAANILPIYPMTIAVLAKDNADPKTGLEYTTQIGDAGFILKLSDGTVTNATWKVKTFFQGPLNRDTANPANPKVQYTPIPPTGLAWISMTVLGPTPLNIRKPALGRTVTLPRPISPGATTLTLTTP